MSHASSITDDAGATAEPWRCVFIGDEVTAAGFRLVGLECPETLETDVTALFKDARAHAMLIIITAEPAARLPPGLLADALREQRPHTIVIGDIRDRVRPPDRAATVKRQLGLAE